VTDSRVADRPAAFWEEVRADYEAGKLTVRAIHAKHDLTPGEFNYAKDRLGWPRRYRTAVSRAMIINRLFRLIDRLTSNLEIEMSSASSPKRAVRETKQMTSIREKLVERIAELKRS